MYLVCKYMPLPEMLTLMASSCCIVRHLSALTDISTEDIIYFCATAQIWCLKSTLPARDGGTLADLELWITLVRDIYVMAQPSIANIVFCVTLLFIRGQ